MIEWITVISLIVLGIGLVVVEIIFVPGTTIVGVMGFAVLSGGIYLGFDYFGNTTGWGVLVGALILALIVIIGAFRSRAWERFSLKTSIKGKVNEGYSHSLKEGQEGVATSMLRPIGKAEFNDEEYEVSTIGNYVNVGNKIKIVKIEGTKIIVEPI
ncbi:MAG: hypothetical protein OEX02_11355 [Cyclobacteriaceae bacterium]|nr:hypothetical protein [Cyclobacteriaceae bacterium]